jgi:hypothetical protein
MALAKEMGIVLNSQSAEAEIKSLISLQSDRTYAGQIRNYTNQGPPPSSSIFTSLIFQKYFEYEL